MPCQAFPANILFIITATIDEGNILIFYHSAAVSTYSKQLIKAVLAIDNNEVQIGGMIQTYAVG